MAKFIFLLVLILGSQFIYAQRNCGTTEYLNHCKAQNPALAGEMEKTNERLHQLEATPQKNRQLITIPVVVHVLYQNAEQDISDQQIFSQIDVLNEDYRKLNANASSIPAAFSSIAADCEIQFCLAARSPQGLASNGITRTQTSVSAFSLNDAMKRSTTGGVDAWPTDKYLNIWVCNLANNLLGFATLPGTVIPALDGVVIGYKFFGRNTPLGGNYNKGRTATHEIGHWLNLIHIWGDDDNASDPCSGSDQVTDTPNQEGSNFQCPSYPSPSCGNTSDMFMNFMDYTDDACMYMFTPDQRTRMQTAMASGTYRSNLTNSSITVCSTAPVPPVAAFTIPATGCVGNAVTAVNSSSGSPTPTYAWSANPSTGVTFSNATATAPTITFANTGTYTITLVASSSAGSPSTSTKVITINNCVLTQCDTLINPGNQLVVFTVPSANGGGYVAGNNGYGDKIKAEYHTQAGISGNRVTGVITYFYKNVNNGTGGNATGTIAIQLYNGNNSTGPAGAAVKTENVTLGTLSTNGIQNQTILAYAHTFATPYSLTANEFFAAIRLPTTSGDTAVVYMMDTLGGPAINTAWEQWSDNVWYAFSNQSAWQGNSTLGIFPIVCPASVGLAASELNSQISIFPNPSSGIINLAFALKNQSNVKIEVTNMLGQTVYSETDNNVSAETKTIRLNDAAKGVYLITVSTASEKLIRKVVIE
jgi:hypothetical protein